MNLAYKSIFEIKSMIHSGEVTSREVWNYFLERTKNLDTKIQSFNMINEKGFNNANSELC
jgi:Asp-tRNA(Asn)/Glu-tRNA(Gln) amidotransferase A subunit family amidase